jgi:aminopeptidase N
VREFETASSQNLTEWADVWVTKRGVPVIRTERMPAKSSNRETVSFTQENRLGENTVWRQKTKLFYIAADGSAGTADLNFANKSNIAQQPALSNARFIFPNYRDYGYGVFLLDDKSRDYVIKNIDKEKDVFLRSMMWGALWELVREAELHPKEFVELAIKVIPSETDETTIQSLLPRVNRAVNYYLSDAQVGEITPRLENLLIEKMQNESTLSKRLTFFRAFLSVASTEKARQVLKDILNDKLQIRDFKLQTLDKFDLVARLAILGDADSSMLLENLSKAETSDDAKRYAYSAAAGFPSKETKAKYFNDFLNNKVISEDWIVSSLYSFNNERQAELTLPFLEKALVELPNLKQDRKIFFVNDWLDAFIAGQKSAEALNLVNKYLAANTKLDTDLRLKILEAVDGLERTVKIQRKFGK